jgi:hypothetical protein
MAPYLSFFPAAAAAAAIAVLVMSCILMDVAVASNLPPQIVDHSEAIIKIRNGGSTVVYCTIRYLGNYAVTFQRLKTINAQKTEVTPLTQGLVVFSPDHLDKYQIRHDDASEMWELTINKLTELDEGKYQCAVQTEPVTYKDFMISVEEAPTFDNQKTTNDQTVKENEKMDLKCYATGDPDPTITWTRHGDAPLPIGGRSWVGSKMHIHRVLREDRGTYRCTASNSAGTVKRDIRVEVQFAPSIEAFRPIIVEHVENEYRRQQGYTEIDGSYAEVDCDVIASPRLTGSGTGQGVIWFKLEKTSGRNMVWNLIEPSKKYRIQTIAQANNEVISKLVITDFNDSDLKKYKCKARNTEGSQEETISLLNRREADHIVINGDIEQWSAAPRIGHTAAPMAIAVGLAVAALLR